MVSRNEALCQHCDFRHYDLAENGRHSRTGCARCWQELRGVGGEVDLAKLGKIVRSFGSDYPTELIILAISAAA